MAASESSKVGGGGGMGGKLYNFASFAIDSGEDEKAVSSLSVSLPEEVKLIGAAVEAGSSRAGSRGGPERVALRSASWHSSEQ